MTAGVREPPPPATHASRAAWRLKGVALSVFMPAVIVGAFFAFIEAFGSGVMPFPTRLVFMIGVSLIATAMGYLSFRIADGWSWSRSPWWRVGLFSTLLMFAPMGLVVWSSVNLAAPPGRGPPIADIPAYLLGSVVTTAFFCFLVAFLRRNTERVGGTDAAPAPPKFLDRLPLKLRGAEIWAVEAEDHYLRLRTSKGQDLILMRLADAIGELEGIEGMQVHRSWWVARDAIADAKRGDGRATLTLKDGCEVPVSRTYAGQLREKGWI